MVITFNDFVVYYIINSIIKKKLISKISIMYNFLRVTYVPVFNIFMSIRVFLIFWHRRSFLVTLGLQVQWPITLCLCAAKIRRNKNPPIRKLATADDA